MPTSNKIGDVIEITERDFTRRKISSWKFNASDKKLADSILEHIIRKYGFNPNLSNSEEKKQLDFTDIDVRW